MRELLTLEHIASGQADAARTHTVTASYKWARDEFVTAQQSHRRGVVQSRRRYLLFGVAVYVCLLLACVAFVENLVKMPRTLIAGFLLFETMALSLVFRNLLHQLLGTEYLKNQWDVVQHRENDTLYEFTPEAITIRDPLASATLRWEALVKIVETECGFLFYSQPHIFHWMPLHAFKSAADVERLRDMIIRSEVPFIRVNTPRVARVVQLHV